MVELGQYGDPLAALAEVEVLDVSGGRGETRLEAVHRQLRGLYRQITH